MPNSSLTHAKKISIPPFDDGKVLAVSGAEYFMEKMTIIMQSVHFVH
ncbi:MAG: hypothetical protein ACOX0J_01525 [Thermoactinomyces vulgaris]